MRFTTSGVIWCLLSALRVILCILPQYGYIQPDEFFQSTEPIASQIFESKTYTAWEFNNTFPLRSIFFPQLISTPVFTLIKYTNTTHNPWILLIGPRLVITLLSFICDFSLYKLLKYCRRSATAMPSLVIFSSSYVTITYLTHTFSNSIETVLLALLLLTIIKSISMNNYSNYNTIGIIVSLGIFNRPTFPVFALSPVLFWLISNSKKSFSLRSVIFRALSLIPSFIITSLILCIIDTLYYKSSFIQLYNMMNNYRWNELLQNIVLTPLNFIIYNIRPSNLANHGLHPPYFHALVSVPLAFSILGLLAYIDIIKIVKQMVQRKTKTTYNSYDAIMLLSFIVPLLGLSLIPHHEPRFLIPSLIPICFLYGHQIYNKKLYFIAWILINITLTIFYGFIHQSGVIKGLFQLNDIILKNDKPIHIVFLRTYLPPRHLLSIPQTSTDVHIHDLSIVEFPLLQNCINELQNLDQKQNTGDIYLLIPGSLTSKLKILFKQNNIQKFNLINQYFPHFTGEDFESSLGMLSTSIQSIQNIQNIQSNIYDAFSLNLWKFWLK